MASSLSSVYHPIAPSSSQPPQAISPGRLRGREINQSPPSRRSLFTRLMTLSPFHHRTSTETPEGGPLRTEMLETRTLQTEFADLCTTLEKKHQATVAANIDIATIILQDAPIGHVAIVYNTTRLRILCMVKGSSGIAHFNLEADTESDDGWLVSGGTFSETLSKITMEDFTKTITCFIELHRAFNTVSTLFSESLLASIRNKKITLEHNPNADDTIIFSTHYPGNKVIRLICNYDMQNKLWNLTDFVVPGATLQIPVESLILNIEKFLILKNEVFDNKYFFVNLDGQYIGRHSTI